MRYSGSIMKKTGCLTAKIERGAGFMNNFKAAMRFLLRRCKNPIVFGLQAFFLLFFCGSSALFREMIGSEDYMISTVFTFLGTMIIVAFVQLHYNDLFVTRYIRNSPCYKAVMTKALPVMNIITSLIVTALVIAANIISIGLEFIEAETLGDTIIMCAVGCGVGTAIGFSVYGYAIVCFSFALLGFLSGLSNKLFGSGINAGLGLDTVTAALVGTGIFVMLCIVRFILSRIFYGRRNAKSINAHVKKTCMR